MALIYVDEIDLKGKRVIARFDFNVPLSKDGKKTITDTTRIDLALPTIKHILENGATKLILMSHFGRPKGEVNPDFSLEPVATYLAEALSEEVILSESATDRSLKNLLDLSKTNNIRLKIRTHNLHKSRNKLTSIKVMLYEVLGGERFFISSQNLTINKSRRFNIVKFCELIKNLTILNLRDLLIVTAY